MTDQIAQFLNIAVTIVAVVIGWLIRDSISNFRGSVEKLDKTLQDLDTTVQGHNSRISKVEWQLKIKGEPKDD